MGKLDLSGLFKNKSTVAGAVIGLALGAGVAAAAITGIGQHGLNINGYDGAMLLKTGDITPVKPPAGAPLSFADMIDRVSPAVVSIEIKGKKKIPAGGIDLPGFDVPGNDDGQGGKEQEFQGAGSGFFISPEGYIVTNNHVIDSATEISVVLKNEKQLKATVVGRDVATDLAVLKVEGHDFPFVRFELERKPRVGDWVIAMGNPFNFSNTATAGIVSAFGRDLKDGGGADYIDYLQIDAAINMGNSGGPTFDLYGRVIGVNTQIVTPSGGNAGLGFAIPADLANRITTQLMKGVKIERGYIGVSILPVTDEVASALGVSDTTGAYVADLTKGGPADRAGIQLGDIVKTVNGQPVKSPTELTRRIADIKAGEKVTLGVQRGGKTVTLTLTAALRPGEDELAKGLNSTGSNDDNDGPSGMASGTPPVIGLSVKPLTPESRRTFGIGNDVNGVVITNVDASSEGGQKGLKAGDVVVLANQQPLTSQADFARVIDEAKKASRTSVLLLINRDGRNLPLLLALK